MRLTSSLSRGIVLCLFLVAFLVLAVRAVSVLTKNSHYEASIDRTKASLLVMRHLIQQFKSRTGGYPDSLATLKTSAQGSKFEQIESDTFVIYTDFQDERTDRIPEHDSLNGEGGFYYDPANGDVRVNLTEPICHYLPSYRGSRSQEVPCEW